jgi:hypothetical protein
MFFPTIRVFTCNFAHHMSGNGLFAMVACYVKLARVSDNFHGE